MTAPVLPSEIVANCRTYAQQNSVTGMDIWDVIQASNPRIDFGDSTENSDRSVAEMCLELIGNNSDMVGIKHYNFVDDDELLLVSSADFIRVLDYLADQYDIANYVLKDGRIWALEEQCWADDL